MTVASTEELVLAELVDTPDGDAGSAGSRSVSDLTETLSLSSHRLSDRIELATTLDALEDEGAIELDAPAESALADERVTFALTDAGRERARDVRDRLASEPVEIVDDSHETCSIAEAADRLEAPLVAVAAEATDDGVYYVSDSPEGEFVGREDALRECETALERVRDGTGRMIAVEGAPGVGKTTLAERLLERAESDGFRVSRARCSRDGTGPYHPLRTALEGSEADPFADVGPAVEDADEYRAQRTALFGDVTDALVAGATEAEPRLLFLDDLHLADVATLEYVDYLRDRLAALPLAVVVGYRPDAFPDDAPLAADAFATADSVIRVELSPFGVDGTRAMIERVLEHRGVPDAFVDVIHDHTGGNPLFVEETLAALLETDQLDPDLGVYPESTAAIDTPDEVRETIDRRIGRFDDYARELLWWASLLGDHLSAALLEAVGELPPAQLRTHLELFVDGAIFDRAEDGGLQFHSEVVREALQAEIPDDERARRHRAIARALRTAGAGDVDAAGSDDADAVDAPEERAGSIAFHLERAGDREAAIEWYRRAAEAATDVYAHELAVERHHDALELAREIDDREAILEIVGEIAEIYVTIGEYDDAERHVRFARERADDAERRQRLLLLASRIATRRGDYERALELLEEGQASTDGTPSRIACELLAQKAFVQRRLSDYARSRELAERQRTVAVELDEPELRATALEHLGSAALRQGAFDDARKYYRRAEAIRRERGDRHGVAKCQHNLGAIARQRGRYDEARDAFEEALAVFRDVGDRHVATQTLLGLGEIAQFRSRNEEARETYEEALAIFREIGDRHGVAKSYNNLGLVAREQGHTGEANDFHHRALKRYSDVGNRRGVAISRHNLGIVARDEDRYEAARDHLERAIEIQRDLEDRHDVAVSYRELGAVAREQGRYDEAHDHFERALEGLDAIGAEHEGATCHVELGRLALRRESILSAREHGEQALETLTELEATDDLLDALELLVECASEQGDVEQGLAWCRRALELLGEREEPTGADDLREWFERRRDHLADRSAETE